MICYCSLFFFKRSETQAFSRDLGKSSQPRESYSVTPALFRRGRSGAASSCPPGLAGRPVLLTTHVCASQVDSAMSLIQAAKNLMNAVVQTVKASYVASTKYQKSQGMASLNLPAVSWKMKAPEKKPLVKREKQDETQTKIKRASQKKHVNPVQALSEFKAMDSI